MGCWSTAPWKEFLFACGAHNARHTIPLGQDRLGCAFVVVLWNMLLIDRYRVHLLLLLGGFGKNYGVLYVTL